MAHPRRANTKPELLERVRKLCLDLPETSEKEAWGGPTFRVKGKMFCMYMDNHHGSDRVSLWCAAPVGAQEDLVELDPKRFFVPPYVGPRGWIGIHIDRRPSWRQVRDVVHTSYRQVAPRRVAALLDASG